MVRNGVMLLGLLAGCGGMTEPESPGFEFKAQPIFGVAHVPPVVQGGRGIIDVTGIFDVPHTDYAISGLLTLGGQGIVKLTVRGIPGIGGLKVNSLHLYQSRVSRLPKGNYEVQLIYVVDKGPVDRDSNLVATVRVKVQ